MDWYRAGSTSYLPCCLKLGERRGWEIVWNILMEQMVEKESLLENEWIDTSAANLQILRWDESSNLKISKYFSILKSLIS